MIFLLQLSSFSPFCISVLGEFGVILRQFTEQMFTKELMICKKRVSFHFITRKKSGTCTSIIPEMEKTKWSLWIPVTWAALSPDKVSCSAAQRCISVVCLKNTPFESSLKGYFCILMSLACNFMLPKSQLTWFLVYFLCSPSLPSHL